MSENNQSRKHKRPYLKLIIAIYLLLFLAVVLVWVGHLGWHGLHLIRLVNDIQAEVEGSTPGDLLPVVEGVAEDTRAIRQDLAPFLPVFNAMQGLPWIGPYLGQIEPMILYLDDLAQAGNEVAQVIKPILGVSQDSKADVSERISQALQSGQAELDAAATLVESASTARQRIRPELMPASLRAKYSTLDEKFSLISTGVHVLQVAPGLLGTNQPQTYLVLAQNRDELRGTGGFISGIGRVTLEDGEISLFELGDSYAIDDFSKPYPAPPEALKRFMLADYWVTRDSNWSPDFPTSARQAQDLYTLSTGNPTQGVIAFNQLAIKRILEVVGPVSLPGIDGPVNADNVENYLAQAWAPEPEQGISQEWWLHRKDFMQQLGLVLLDRIFKVEDQGQMIALAQSLYDLLLQGQVRLYFNDPQVEQALVDAGMAGGVAPGNGDYLYLVDSNVGFNKVDAVVQRSLAYKVDLSDPAHPRGTASITYQHTGSGTGQCKQEISYGNGTYQDMQQRCYLDYWRLYVPGGSVLTSDTAQPVPADALLNGQGWSGQVESQPGEAGSEVFAGLLMMPQGRTSEVTISYDLPPSVLQEGQNGAVEYSVLIPIQPGVSSLPFSLEVTLPSNSSMLSPGEGWTSSDGISWHWQGNLDKPIELNLIMLQNDALR